MNYLEIGYWSLIFTVAYVNRYKLLIGETITIET